MDELDAACKIHDLATEPRGPYTSKGEPKKLRDADRILMNKANALARGNYRKKSAALSVAAAMKLLLRTGARGRK